MNRRRLLAGAGAAAAGMGLSTFPLGWAAAQGQQVRRLLFFSKSSGFEHPVIKRVNGEPSHVEKVLAELGPKHGFEVTSTKDGSVFTPENLARYDAFFFYTTGDLTTPGTDKNPPMTPQGKQALLDAIRAGKGFIGTHSATDTFHTQPDPPDRSNRFVNHGDRVDPYVAMIGAEFIRHGPQQVAGMRVVDTRFPGMAALNVKTGEQFRMMEEWYSLKDFRPDLHVLLVQETEGMNGSDYQRPPYPSTWARKHGQGRVFYTSMGHREDVWTSPIFQSVFLGGLSWVFGNVEADLTPNIAQVTPGYRELPPRPA
ncbi:MAG: ThuA domain-containing protein [Armatimonadota bacterium]